MVTIDAYLEGARAPTELVGRSAGPWRVDRWVPRTCADYARAGRFPDATVLSRAAKLAGGYEWRETVMIDTERALRRHLPLWEHAAGRVLVTGLGLGCAVRGLLVNPEVTHVTVVELDPNVVDLVWPEFCPDSRCELILGNALSFPLEGHRFDWAWHDLFIEATSLSGFDKDYNLLHHQVVERLRPRCSHQGYWAMPEPVIVY